MIKLLILYGLLLIPINSYSESNPEIDKAITEYNSNNKSSAIKRMQILVEEEPLNYKARWYLLHYTVLDFSLPNIKLISNSDKEIKEIIKLAKENNDQAFTHYVMSIYARNHRAYDVALQEINKALEIKSDSLIYNYTKAELLVKMGGWNKDYDLIREGIKYYKKTDQLAELNQRTYFSKKDFHFKMGRALSNLKMNGGCPESIIEHYIAVTQLGDPEDINVAYAWNNVSCAYRAIGECDKAIKASENALKIKDFGAARTNLKYSKFCKEMKKLDLWNDIALETEQ